MCYLLLYLYRYTLQHNSKNQPSLLCRGTLRITASMAFSLCIAYWDLLEKIGVFSAWARGIASAQRLDTDEPYGCTCGKLFSSMESVYIDSFLLVYGECVQIWIVCV